MPMYKIQWCRSRLIVPGSRSTKFKIKKVWVEWGGGRQQTSEPTFFRFRLTKYNFLWKRNFCRLNSAFPFILWVILYLWPTGPNESGSDRIRIHITDKICRRGCFDKAFPQIVIFNNITLFFVQVVTVLLVGVQLGMLGLIYQYLLYILCPESRN